MRQDQVLERASRHSFRLLATQQITTQSPRASHRKKTRLPPPQVTPSQTTRRGTGHSRRSYAHTASCTQVCPHYTCNTSGKPAICTAVNESQTEQASVSEHSFMPLFLLLLGSHHYTCNPSGKPAICTAVNESQTEQANLSEDSFMPLFLLLGSHHHSLR